MDACISLLALIYRSNKPFSRAFSVNFNRNEMFGSLIRGFVTDRPWGCFLKYVLATFALITSPYVIRI